MKPKSLYNWLTRCMYNRRCRINPWWIDLVVGGIQDGEPFLGHVDVRGRAYEDKVVATGFGKHLAIPLLREYSENPNAVLNYDSAQTLVSILTNSIYSKQFHHSIVSCSHKFGLFSYLPFLYPIAEEVHGSAILPRLSQLSPIQSGCVHEGGKQSSGTNQR